MSKDSYTIRIGAFSTNIDSISPIAILRQFFTYSECRNVSYIKESHVEFEHALQDDGDVCHIIYIEVSNYEKKNSVLSCGDGFIIFVDLEDKQSFSILQSIVDYIKLKSNGKKLYVVGIYSLVDNIQKGLEDSVFKGFLDKAGLPYEYSEVSSESQVDIVKLFDKMVQDCLDNKSKGQDRDDFAISGKQCLII